MQNVIIAWCKTNNIDFENFVPLEFVGKRNLKLGFQNNINVLFLEGFSFLSSGYKDSLKSLGYVLHDVSDIYLKLDQKYRKLDRFGDYEKKCFLRWPVIETFFSNEKIVHYDGDIIFNEDPKVILNKVKDKTFVLQGCPAFTVISDKIWFCQYKKELDFFAQDIEKYSADAWKKRIGWEVTFKTRWAGSRFRKIITSDQDFISHLIHTGSIKQDSVEDLSLRLNDYMFFENPLFIHNYHDNFPYAYKRDKGIDFFEYKREDVPGEIYKKKILFWHMQSCFNFYLAKSIPK